MIRELRKEVESFSIWRDMYMARVKLDVLLGGRKRLRMGICGRSSGGQDVRV